MVELFVPPLAAENMFVELSEESQNKGGLHYFTLFICPLCVCICKRFKHSTQWQSKTCLLNYLRDQKTKGDIVDSGIIRRHQREKPPNLGVNHQKTVS